MNRKMLPAVFTITAFLFSSLLFAQGAAAGEGMKVYTAQKCQVCHSIAGKGNKKNPLDGVGKKLSTEDIRKWIVNPKGMKG